LPERYSSLAAEELKRWRRELSADLGVPPFIIFNDATLFALAAALPASRDEFMRVKGTGESRWERFGPKILQICVMARANGDVPQAAAPVVIRRRR
jgi:ATP-dependent DNA helicase RecQ